MPRKNPFPSREAEICKRLREFRLSTGLSQVTFAKHIGTDSTRLANHEHCRSPLKYGLANRLADEFDVCQRWLATGKLPANGYVDIAPAVEANLKPDSLFSSVYDNHLSPLVDAYIALIAETLKCREEEVDGEKAFRVGASPAGSEAWDTVRKILIQTAKLYNKRDGNNSARFVHELTELLDKIFPDAGSRGLNNIRTQTNLFDDLLSNVLEIKNALSEEGATNYLKQVAHYAWTLGEDYINPRRKNMIALANSKRPEIDYRQVLTSILGLPNTAPDEEILKAQRSKFPARKGTFKPKTKS
ncbi:MAG TPA: helix-turn-helix transcriptional regulator [Candidatus Methylacidiphilales bacterium]|nr:helix-turn-helix transcriptional regulator [Candidatus Methylacidiphilales bacterium]